MPETIGLLILDQVGFAVLGSFTIGATGISVASIVGSSVIIGTGLAISYATKPSLPKPSDGQQATRQAIPPRIAAFGRVRLAGVYMFYEESAGNSVDVIAMASGKVAGFVRYYLHEDEVIIDPGTGYVVACEIGDGRYLNKVRIKTRNGLPTETYYSEVIAPWTPAHRGDGIASLALICLGTTEADFQKVYPSQLPAPSAVVDAFAVWDPRDPSQSPLAPSTWTNYPDYSSVTVYGAGARVLYRGAVYYSRLNGNIDYLPDLHPDRWCRVCSNPVLQLIRYLTDNDFGMGHDFAVVITPVLSALIVEANLCDDLVPKIGGFEPRYVSNGFFYFETDPAEVQAAILASCDGWMAYDGEGALALKVGVYRAPTQSVITADHILAINPSFGVADEEKVNELVPSFTSPEHKYKELAGQSWRDEEDISDRGVTRSKNLPLIWVQSHSQARRVTKRQFDRMNAPIQGTVVTTLYGLDNLGKRWGRMQFPDLPGLEDVVVEFGNVKTDIMAGQVSFSWSIVNTNTIDAWDPNEDEGSPPPQPDDVAATTLPMPEHLVAVAVGVPGGGVRIDVSFDDLNRSDLIYLVQYNLDDAGGGQPGPPVQERVASAVSDGLTTRLVTGVVQAEQVYTVQVCVVGSAGTYGPFSFGATVNTTASSVAPTAPVSVGAVNASGTVTVSWVNPNAATMYAARVWRGTTTFAAATDISGQLFGASNQAMSVADTPGAGAWKYWVTAENAGGVKSSPGGPATVTV